VLDPPPRPPSIDGCTGPVSDDGSEPAGRQYSARWEFAPADDAPALLRSLLRDKLADWGLTRDGDVEAVLVVVSELVTNSIQHARTRFDVSVEFDGTAILVAVHDHSPALPRLLGRGLGGAEELGLGLAVVDALAARWGATATAHGKTVWARMPPNRCPGTDDK
jgi:signal transduction histidine kinase